MKKFYQLTGIFWIAVSLHTYGQDFSNKGKEFWLAYSYHVGMSGGGAPVMTLYITSDQTTAYTVEIYGVSTLQSGTINAGQVLPVVIPNSYFIDNEGLFTGRTVRVTAQKAVVVYSYITRQSASGATVCLPTPVLGKEYFSMNFTQVSNEPNSNSYVTVIAVEDNTAVEITPAANTKNGWIAGTTYTVNLNKGQIYQVLGTTSGNNGVDLMGTKIKSVSSAAGGCKRIAVFSGSGKIRIPGTGCGSNSSDNLYQQLYPTGSWGKKYLTVPSYNRPNNYYRIIKNDPLTNVYLNGVLIPAASFINGVYYQFFNNSPNLIEADLPISVAQYFTTQNCDGNGNPYDPDMIVLNPVEQNINNVTLVSSNMVATPPQHHIHVIMRNGGTGISSFKLDGVAVPVASWTPHPNELNYSYLYIGNVTQGYHTLSSDSGFNALAYGYAPAESYGYSAGANVKDQYQFITIQNQYATVNFPASCRGTPFYFSIVFPYEPTQIQWIFGPVLNGMGISDITINNPVFDSTWFVNGKQVYRYKLPAAYTISTTGTYPVKVIATNPTPDGCGGVQEIDFDLQVFDPPVADFNFSTTGCVTSPVNFTDNTNTGGRPVINWAWNFGDGVTSTIQNPSHTFAAPGSYTTSLTVITDVGCISDPSTDIITLTQAPVAKFGASLPRCAGKAITFSDSSVVSGGAVIAKWYWTFGDGSPVVVATSNFSQLHTYPAAGSYTASLMVETTTGCQSILYSENITISANPVANFSVGDICLPAGTASFISTSTIPSGSITGYSWNFGDGNTSSQQNPVHNYTGTGPYTVILQVTSANGCVDDTSRLISNIYAPPQAVFTAPGEVCLGTAISFTDQSSAPNSSISQWIWDFGDMTSSALQNPVKNYSSPGTYTVSLTVISAVGCSSAVFTKNVTVNPLPTAGFSTSLPACENHSITFTDASVAQAGNLVKWTWNYGDGGNNVIASNGNPVTHIYNSPGTYTARLQVETDKGCISTVFSQPVNIHVLPVAGFIAPEVCLADPFAPFTDTSRINSGTITGWLWNFGDPNANAGNPNTSTLQNPSHRYSVVGNYTATLIVTSDQGCTDTIVQSFTVNGSVPQANFTVQNASTLCSNQPVTITDASTVDFGNLIRTVIYWDYTNDPTIQTTDNSPVFGKNYSHLYPEFGSPSSKTVTIKMVTYSGINCVHEISRTITLLPTPVLQFDPLSGICSDAPSFLLTQGSILNALPGSGIYSGPGVSAMNRFSPAIAGVGIHTLRYSFTATNGCSNFKEQTIEVFPTPAANAGPDKFLLEGGVVQLTPALTTGIPVSYTWSPSSGLSNPNIPDPLASPTDDITYTLTVTSDKGCQTSDQVFVKVLKAPEIPNIFSPNGDGIHDQWVIGYLETYPGCTVEVFNRYGQRVFYSIGYSKPWDGTVNGKPAPVGTYYYIVDPKNGRKQMAGYVDLIR